MGQYHLILNLDRQQFLEPHAFGDGAKLMEFGTESQGTMTALAILLARDNGLGGGDLHLPENTPDADLIGSWAGSRISIVGDYGPPEDVLEVDRTAFFASVAGRQFAERYPNRQPNLYQVAQAIYENVSDRAIRLLQLDPSGAGKLRHIDLNDQQRSRFEMIQEGERPEIEAMQKLERERMRDLVLEDFSRMPMERIAELLSRHTQKR